MPILRHIANLWTFMGHPTPEAEWTLDQKLDAIQEAGFDGVCWAGSRELNEGCLSRGLLFVGGIASGEEEAFPALLQNEKQYGAHHVNVQLAAHDTPTPEALHLTRTLLEQAKLLGLEPAIESHRNTATETPEKLFALADAYQDATGELLPISWDFSHFAIVKHLVPSNFIERLLVRPDLIQRAQQFHFRPFNGHHAQVPVTDSRGNLTQEVRDWMPFAEAILRCWLETNTDRAREMFLCPELGPGEGGYRLSTFPNSWEDAKVLRGVIDDLWRRTTS
jgi:sugar phosphate isomerase/epimerase